MITRNTYLVLLTGLFLLASCIGNNKDNKQLDTTPKKQMDNFVLTPEKAHPKAKQIMTEEFYWSPIEESGPFGSDDGSDAFYSFRQWRVNNKTVSPTVYLKELNEEWGYQSDEATIAIGFGQFVLEGRIDEDIKALTKEVLSKQLKPSLIEKWQGDYQNTRTEQLTKMLATVDRMNE